MIYAVNTHFIQTIRKIDNFKHYGELMWLKRKKMKKEEQIVNKK